MQFIWIFNSILTGKHSILINNGNAMIDRDVHFELRPLINLNFLAHVFINLGKYVSSSGAIRETKSVGSDLRSYLGILKIF